MVEDDTGQCSTCRSKAGLGVAIGIGVGAAMGSALGNMEVCIAAGVPVGFLIGRFMTRAAIEDDAPRP